MSVRAGAHQGAGEPGPPVGGVARQLFYLAHRHRIVTAGGRLGPIGGADAGRAIQGGDGKAAVIGQRRQAGGARRRQRLDPRIAEEAVLRLGRLRQAEGAGADDLEPPGGEKRGNFPQLAGIVGGQHQLAPRQAPARHAFTASRCRAMM